MSGDVIKEFLVSLGLQVEGEANFSGAIGKASLAVIGLGAVVAAATTAMFAFTKGVAEEFDALADLSARVNTTADSLQELGYVASLTDSSLEASNASIEQLAKNAGDAALGLGRAGKTFGKIGVDVKDSNGKLKNSVDLLYEVGDAIKDMESGEQISIMQRLGIDKTMLAAITTDVGGLREEFRKTYEAVGLDTNKAAEASSQFMDSLTRLNFVTGAIGKSLAVNFMSKFTDAMDRLRRLIVDNLPKIMAVLKPVIAVVLAVADVFIALAYRAGQAIGVVIGWISDINDATDGWLVKIAAVALAWRYLNLAFLATPVGMILSAAVAIGLLIDDFMTWKEGGDSLIAWGEWSAEIAMVETGLGALRNFLEGWFTFLFAAIDTIVSLLSGDFAGAWIAVQIAAETVANALSTMFGPALDIVKEQFDVAFAWVTSIIDAIMAKINAVGGSISGFVGSVGDVVGGAAEFFGVGGDSGVSAPAPLIPAPAQAAAMSNSSSQSVSQETSIIVNGGTDPQATGAAVAAQQRNVNNDMVRNMKGAVR